MLLQPPRQLFIGERRPHCELLSAYYSAFPNDSQPLIMHISTKSTSGGVVHSVKSLFWTVYYFFYFLLTGQPEWKCESHTHEPLIGCCGRANEENTTNLKWNSSHSAASSRSNGHVHHDSGRHEYPWSNSTAPPSTAAAGGWWARFKGHLVNSWNWLKRNGKRIGEKAIQMAKYIPSGFCWLWNKLKDLFAYLTSYKQSKALPPTQLGPKPFSPDSPSFNKVSFDPDFKFQAFKQNLNETVQHQFEDCVKEEEDFDERTLREPSVPPPAPPPPPLKPVRIERSVEPEPAARITVPQMESYQERREHKEPERRNTAPKGVSDMAKEVMAELSGRLSRGPSAQREMTQSCHPDMAEWKDEGRYDRSGSATPWGRASSVGPTMRRLEQVVSRLENNGDNSDNEAQFVFRPPPTRAPGYQMGKSVFGPVEEAEKMRDSINSKSFYEASRPVTPSSYYTDRRYQGGESELRQRAKTVEPGHSQYQNTSGIRPFTPSLAYSSAPFTSHTARRSKTPVSFDRGNNFAYDRNDISDGVVNHTARRWPPVSNATGAVVKRDNWLNDMLGRSDDGLITTMCRRVVERKTEDNWKWRDDAGRLVDEQNQRRWKGELDTVVRDGPDQGRQWSRTVEVKPNGTTLFQDVSRQYDRNFVVESVIRNY